MYITSCKRKRNQKIDVCFKVQTKKYIRFKIYKYKDMFHIIIT